MPAPSTQMTTQQVKDNPAYGNFQNRQQLIQKWQSIFSNEQICKQYVGFVGALPEKNVIPVPEDINERKIAQEVAQEVLNKPRTYAYKHDESRQYQENVCTTAARLFLRACASYTKKYTKTGNKTAKSLIKQGAGAFSQSQLLPATQNLPDVKQAACNAGRMAALYEVQARSQNPEEVKQAQQNFNSLMQSINGTLTSDKRYNTYFFFTYLTTIAGENKDGKMLDVGKNTGYQTNEEEMERKQNLNYLISKVQAYEKELHPIGQFEKPKDTNQYFQQQRLISDRQPYSQAGGRQ